MFKDLKVNQNKWIYFNKRTSRVFIKLVGEVLIIEIWWINFRWNLSKI